MKEIESRMSGALGQQEREDLPCWKHFLPQHRSCPRRDHPHPEQETETSELPWAVAGRNLKLQSGLLCPWKSRPGFCACGLTRVSPPFIWKDTSNQLKLGITKANGPNRSSPSLQIKAFCWVGDPATSDSVWSHITLSQQGPHAQRTHTNYSTQQELPPQF